MSQVSSREGFTTLPKGDFANLFARTGLHECKPLKIKLQALTKIKIAVKDFARNRHMQLEADTGPKRKCQIARLLALCTSAENGIEASAAAPPARHQGHASLPSHTDHTDHTVIRSYNHTVIRRRLAPGAPRPCRVSKPLRSKLPILPEKPWCGPGAGLVRAWCGPALFFQSGSRIGNTIPAPDSRTELPDRSRTAGLRPAGLAPRPKPPSRPHSKTEAAQPASLSGREKGHPRTVSRGDTYLRTEWYSTALTAGIEPRAEQEARSSLADALAQWLRRRRKHV